MADDICQEVIARILEGKCSSCGAGDAEGFLLGVAKNILHELLNAKKQRIHHLRQTDVLDGSAARNAESLTILESIET